MKHRVVTATFTGPQGERVFGGHLEDPKDEGTTLCGRPVSTKKSSHTSVTCSLCFTRSGGTVRGSRYAPPPTT